MAGIGYYLKAYRRNGFLYSCRRLWEKGRERYAHTYEKMWQRIAPTEQELERQRQTPIEGVGLISVVIPVYNTRPQFLRELADSLTAQTYPLWEACLYDGASDHPDTVAALDELAAAEPRLKVLHGTANDGISGNSNHALAMAQGEWIALCDHDDLLTPDALYCVAEAIQRESPDMLYSDEDKISELGEYHHSPHFKPDFCPDNLNSGNYICHLLVMRRSLVDAAGGFRSDFDGSQDHDLTMRCAEHTDKICHIPRVLYHWRTVGSSMSHQHLDKCVDASCRAAKEHMERLGRPCTVEAINGQPRFHYTLPEKKTVSLVLIDSGDPKTWGYFLYRLGCVDTEVTRKIVVSPLEQSADDVPGARWIRWDAGETVYAALNRAIQLCDTDYVLFLHSGVMMNGRDWMNELMSYAQRDDVGAVTPQIYDDHSRVIHGGFAVGMDKIVSCRGRGLPRRVGGWHLMMTTSHNVAAVSLACCMIRRDHLLPFDEGYITGIGMADWCLRLGKQGLHHVFTPFAGGRTRDTTTRSWLLCLGSPNEKDAARFRQAWPDCTDPCYSPWFSRKKADYSLPKEV